MGKRVISGPNKLLPAIFRKRNMAHSTKEYNRGPTSKRPRGDTLPSRRESLRSCSRHHSFGLLLDHQHQLHQTAIRRRLHSPIESSGEKHHELSSSTNNSPKVASVRNGSREVTAGRLDSLGIGWLKCLFRLSGPPEPLFQWGTLVPI